jgi:hypothetical protein
LELTRLTMSIPAIEAIDADDRIVRTPVGIWIRRRLHAITVLGSTMGIWIRRRLHAITVLGSTIPKTGKWNQIHLNAVNTA